MERKNGSTSIESQVKNEELVTRIYRKNLPNLSVPKTLLRYLRVCANKKKRKPIPALAYYCDEKNNQSLTISSTSHESAVRKLNPIIEAQPYSWPHNLTFNSTSTALVVIDMQKDFCSPDGYLFCQGYDISPLQRIIPCLQKLLNVFRANNFPIYHTREGHRADLSTLSPREQQRSRNNLSGLGIGDMGPLGRLLIRGEAGHDIIPELYPQANEPIIDKPGRSAFQHTEFKLMLDIKGIRNLIFCGVTTDVCVHSTMREANDNGFDCLLIEDATAAIEERLHVSAVESVKAEGGIFGAVASTQNILMALNVEETHGYPTKQSSVYHTQVL